MRPARVFTRTTIPMVPRPAPSWAGRTTEPAPLPWLVNPAARLTEPVSAGSRGAVLPFRSAVPVQHSCAPEPSEHAPTRPARMPAEVAPDSSRSKQERDAMRAFCFVVLGALLLGNGALWIALALHPAPTPAPVVVPSLPVALLAALASSSSTRPPEASAAPASSSAPTATSAAPVRPRAPTRPLTPPPRASMRGEIVNPWGD